MQVIKIDARKGARIAERILVDERARLAARGMALMPKGTINLAKAVAMQRTMLCAACGGRIVIEPDDEKLGRLMCMLCSRTVANVSLDISCQVGEN